MVAISIFGAKRSNTCLM